MSTSYGPATEPESTPVSGVHLNSCLCTPEHSFTCIHTPWENASQHGCPQSTPFQPSGAHGSDDLHLPRSAARTRRTEFSWEPEGPSWGHTQHEALQPGFCRHILAAAAFPPENESHFLARVSWTRGINGHWRPQKSRW